MKVEDERVTGYILLSKGVTMVVFSVCSISTVFTGSQGPLHLFDFSDFYISIPRLEGGTKPFG